MLGAGTASARGTGRSHQLPAAPAPQPTAETRAGAPLNDPRPAYADRRRGPFIVAAVLHADSRPTRCVALGIVAASRCSSNRQLAERLGRRRQFICSGAGVPPFHTRQSPSRVASAADSASSISPPAIAAANALLTRPTRS